MNWAICTQINVAYIWLPNKLGSLNNKIVVSMLVGLAKDIKVDWKGGNLSGGKNVILSSEGWSTRNFKVSKIMYSPYQFCRKLNCSAQCCFEIIVPTLWDTWYWLLCHYWCWKHQLVEDQLEGNHLEEINLEINLGEITLEKINL